MTHSLQFLLIIAGAAPLVDARGAGSDNLSVERTKESTVEGRSAGANLRFSPVDEVGLPLNKASSLTELHHNAEPTLGMACSDAMVNTATISSSSCAKENGICKNGPIESVMDGQVDHAWRPENVTTLDYLEYTWQSPVMVRYIQTSGLAIDAAVAPACKGACGAPKQYRVQYQDAQGIWKYYTSFADTRQALPYTDLDGEARPPDTRMQTLTPPVESKKIRLRFVDWAGEKVAARASMRGCLASATAAGDLTLNAPFSSIFPAAYSDVKTFANTLKGVVEHESSIQCTADQIAVQAIGPATGSSYTSGSTTVRVMFFPKGNMAAGEQPTACVQALGTVTSTSTSELSKWAADVLRHAHPITVPTCENVNCGIHGNCAAGKCFCHTGFQGSDCSVEIPGEQGYGNKAAATAGSEEQGLGDAAPQLLPVTPNALTFGQGGPPPTDEEIMAEMAQIVENLRMDNALDESGLSGKVLRNPKFVLGVFLGSVISYIALVAIFAKTTPSTTDRISASAGAGGQPASA